ncbi:MAG TPA: beta-ketoacyl synthase N-terminal-like domain-containing protein, partial [Povalibacter sp.]
MPDQNQTASDAPVSPAGPSTLERQALVALRKMRQKLDDLERARTEPIAIVGIGCRLPGGANSPEAFWNLLCNGVDAITEVPPDRWRIDDYFDPRPGVPGKTYSRWGGFMDRIDAFDADFFGISPREVVRMDPQQRVFLEVAWEALEDAGIPPHTLKESNTGIFAGTTTTDYLQYHLQHGTRDDLDAYIISGNTINATSGRLAFFLGTHGPTISMDTACSSSLVAVDRACRSVRDGECPLAIAGGVNLILAPELFVCMSKWGMLAPDGRCKTFDASADGFVRAEGCGIVILKRLRDALADGNRILAVIRGSAVNQDGPSSGLSVPNGLAQEAVVRAALNNAGVDPAAIGYVETHGTGTSLGDPIEVDALARVFQPVRDQRTPLALGSVKTNLGHLEAAAGVAGLLKVVLMLQHRTLAPHLHLRNPSPHIAWDQYPFTVPTSATGWSPVGEKRLAGVSAFGFSGTNVHLILEEAPAVTAAGNEQERPLQILTLSARTETALWKLAEATQARLAQDRTPALADVCFTANAGRTPFGQRLSVVGATSAEIGGLLARHLRGETAAGLATSRISGKERHRIGFLFTGQGSQYAGMARQLFDSSPLFRRTLERCDELLRPHLERPLLSVLYPGDGNDLIRETRYTQPALFAIEYALGELWRSWGVQPAFVMGHSVGEYVAACVAGVFSLEDGLRLIAERARLMQAEPAGGRMVAVRANEEQVRAAIAPFARTVALAAINGPQSVVISGVADQVAKVVAGLAAEGVATKELKVSHAFHSPLMEPMLDRFETAVASVHLHPPQIRLVSNLTGKVVGADEITRPGYWRRHVREAVQFDGSVKTLEAAGCDIFLELGPAPVLLGMARQCVTGQQARWLPTLRPGRDDWVETLASVQALYHAGVPFDWKGFDRDYTRHLDALPTYPFQRERHWIESRAAGDALIAPDFSSTMAANTHPLAGELVRSPALTDTVVQTRISARQPAFLQDHQICGRVIFPATAYFELVLANAQRLWAGESIWIKDVALQEALTLNSESQALVQVLFRKDTDESAAFEIFSTSANAMEPNATWTRHIVGRVHHVATPTEQADRVELARLRERCTQFIEPATFYSRLRAQGSQFGPEFRSVRTLHRGEAEAVAEIQLNETLRAEAARCRMHPALLDGCLQTSVAALPLGLDSTAPDEVLMPVRIESVHIVRSGMTALWCHARPRGSCDAKARSFVTDLDLVAADGSKVGEVRGFEVRRVNRRLLEADGTGKEEDWPYEIEWREAASEEHTASTKVSGTWLVLADSTGVAIAMRERLATMGQQCVLARPGNAFRCLPDGSYTIQPAVAGQFAQLLSACESSHGAPLGIIHLWSLDAAPLEGLAADQLDHVQLLGCGAALQLVQTATTLGQTQASALLLVTRAAQAVTGSKAPLQPAGAPLIGLGRVIATEHPELTCRCVDLDAATTTAQDAADLCGALLNRDSKEGEFAIRGGKLLVPRLVRLRREASDKGVQPPAEAAQGGIRLDAPEPRMIENLRWVRAERQSPAAGEVEVAVYASGLNFRDVLCALGMYPGKAATIGGECAGIVVRTGDGVTDLKPGDRVMGFAPASFASFVTLRRDFISRIPEGLAFSAGASIPVVFLTTLYGLQRLANLKQGDRVLIHAAAGGVGLSAVQLAQQAGAEIFATVGNPEKRAHLTALGVKHVFDSRSLSFADVVMRATGGRGVDVVLNSLAGEFIAKSVAVLAPGGRFLELGKRGILTPAEFAVLRPDCTYHAY